MVAASWSFSSSSSSAKMASQSFVFAAFCTNDGMERDGFRNMIYVGRDREGIVVVEVVGRTDAAVVVVTCNIGIYSKTRRNKGFLRFGICVREHIIY